MNDELKTKEYLKSLESLTLADSSRLRIREELKSFVQFHTATNVAQPVKSPFAWLLLKPVQAAFAFVLVLGAGTALYLGEDGTYEVPSVATIESPVLNEQSTSSSSPAEAQPKEEPPKLAVAPATISNPPTTPTKSAPQESLMRSAAKHESADMVNDGMMMTTMLSQGEMNSADLRADIILREKTYRELILKYQTDLSEDVSTELTQKLDTVATLLKEVEGKEESEARPLLNSALVIIGEVEATLSLLGTVTIENGVIVAIDFES